MERESNITISTQESAAGSGFFKVFEKPQPTFSNPDKVLTAIPLWTPLESTELDRLAFSDVEPDKVINTRADAIRGANNKLKRENEVIINLISKSGGSANSHTAIYARLTLEQAERYKKVMAQEAAEKAKHSILSQKEAEIAVLITETGGLTTAEIAANAFPEMNSNQAMDVVRHYTQRLRNKFKANNLNQKLVKNGKGNNLKYSIVVNFIKRELLRASLNSKDFQLQRHGGQLSIREIRKKKQMKHAATTAHNS